MLPASLHELLASGEPSWPWTGELRTSWAQSKGNPKPVHILIHFSSHELWNKGRCLLTFFNNEESPTFDLLGLSQNVSFYDVNFPMGSLSGSPFSQAVLDFPLYAHAYGFSPWYTVSNFPVLTLAWTYWPKNNIHLSCQFPVGWQTRCDLAASCARVL